jgi:hypothetical protein
LKLKAAFTDTTGSSERDRFVAGECRRRGESHDLILTPLDTMKQRITVGYYKVVSSKL